MAGGTHRKASGWTNFRYAAEQAGGLSRQFGGVHFEHGDKDAGAAGASA